ncbi:hypothetical protein F8M41_004739 [Gigaspora margarita]|uniref:Uncharacterized protein n=1 Tax=Gigaspora margarita TaxID=4874 RepID=A0A8H3XA19_GIGMA|nr:hypothetical protein F8M41_004739 [Gigaspora margarita]
MSDNRNLTEIVTGFGYYGSGRNMSCMVEAHLSIEGSPLAPLSSPLTPLGSPLASLAPLGSIGNFLNEVYSLPTLIEGYEFMFKRQYDLDRRMKSKHPN